MGIVVVVVTLRSSRVAMENHPYEFKDDFLIKLSLSGDFPLPCLEGITCFRKRHWMLTVGGLQTSMVPLAYGGVGRADYERDLARWCSGGFYEAPWLVFRDRKKMPLGECHVESHGMETFSDRLPRTVRFSHLPYARTARKSINE